MAVRKKTSRKKATNRRTLDGGLRELEKRVPKNLKGTVRDLRSRIRDLQKQADRLRRERDQRWQKLETQARSEITKLLRRVEKAVAPAPRRKSATRKKTARKKATRKTTRKKATRKKTRR